MIDTNKILGMEKDANGIYSYHFQNKSQQSEIQLRTEVAGEDLNSDDLLETVCKHHSIEVMDREVKLFLKKMPPHAMILDIGGCWGWHWRNLDKIRPDITVFIVDFIRPHLLKAKTFLGSMIDKNIFLVHGDATQLIFDNEVFDGVWTVQVFQHIPDFEQPVKEAYRVLKPGGYFINYSWTNAFWVRVVYAIINKIYYVYNYVPGRFWLARASQKQIEIIEKVFHNKVVDRHSEILFTPDFRVYFPGALRSITGFIDSYLSNNFGLFSSIARQRSFQVQKPNIEDKNKAIL